MTAPSTERRAPDHLAVLADDWRQSLRQRNKSAETLRTYMACVERFIVFLSSHGMPVSAESVTREHVESFIIELLDRNSDAYASKNYRTLHLFFGWLVDDGEITTSPMARMKPPRVTEKPVPVIPDEHLIKLFGTCKGSDFLDRRDYALITFMADTGCRIGEVMGMTLDDYDVELRRVQVTGKGSRTRHVKVNAGTLAALRHYLRARRKTPVEDSVDAFWLNRRFKPLTDKGVSQMLDRRCAEAGIPHIHPHQFRHTMAHNYKLDGGQETELMAQGGWRSHDMVARYGRSAANERALQAHGALSLVDKLLRVK